MGINLCDDDRYQISCDRCGLKTQKIRGQAEAMEDARENGWRYSRKMGLWRCPSCASEKGHDVRLDYVGFSPRPRLTCYSQFCNGATLVAQPYMTQEIWDSKKKEFLAKHPCFNIPDEGWRGG